MGRYQKLVNLLENVSCEFSFITLAQAPYQRFLHFHSSQDDGSLAPQNKRTKRDTLSAEQGGDAEGGCHE
jgi:hypothetical protein